MTQPTHPRFLEINGPGGTLKISSDDKIAIKFAMLFEVACFGESPTKIAKKYGYTKQRFFQLLHQFKSAGTDGLAPQKTGPQKKWVCNANMEKQVIRMRFHDPDAKTEVIAQKLCQAGFHISARSVERIIEKYGLQKKNLPIQSQRKTAGSRSPKNENKD